MIANPDEIPERVAGVALEELWGLLERCWRKEPDQRPKIEEVLKEVPQRRK
jgi:hypothetical protein